MRSSRSDREGWKVRHLQDYDLDNFTMYSGAVVLRVVFQAENYLSRLSPLRIILPRSLGPILRFPG